MTPFCGLVMSMQRRTWALQVWWSPRTWPGRGRCSGCSGSGWSARARAHLPWERSAPTTRS
uniref:Alternative protein PNKD n=1 Tax=Homo sapiens TaxID=9606 RepID=L8EAT5_HUMAN|nr:alternative protein PNKD [Homo sapiens]